MKGTPRDARLAILALFLMGAAFLWPPPAPSAHIEHHHTKRVPTTHTFTVGYHTIETEGRYVRLEQDTITKQLVWRFYNPFPTREATK